MFNKIYIVFIFSARLRVKRFELRGPNRDEDEAVDREALVAEEAAETIASTAGSLVTGSVIVPRREDLTEVAEAVAVVSVEAVRDHMEVVALEAAVMEEEVMEPRDRTAVDPEEEEEEEEEEEAGFEDVVEDSAVDVDVATASSVTSQITGPESAPRSNRSRGTFMSPAFINHDLSRLILNLPMKP